MAFYSGETPDEALHTKEYACDWYRIPKDVFELAAGTHGVNSSGRRAFRYLCVRVSGCSARLSVTMTDARYPVRQRGSFRCSDPLLERIWDSCAQTLSCCMQQFYEDGVKRDGLLWTGDYRIAFPAAWYAFGDAALAARSLRMIAASQQPDGSIPACAAFGGGHQHPERIDYMPGIPHGSTNRWLLLNYCTDFISAVSEYHLHTGDAALVRELFPAVRRLTDFLTGEPLSLARSADGMRLLDAPGTPGIRYEHFVDCQTNPNAFIASPCAFLFMLVKALQDCAALAALCGDTAYASKQDALQRGLLADIRARFYDPKSDLYRDREGQALGNTPLYTVVHGALCGATTGAGAEKLAGAPFGLYPYFTAWALSALFELGQGQAALDAVRTHWGKMLTLSDTCWERLDADLLFDLHPDAARVSLCHAWGGHPAWHLPAYVLGVRPTAAGYAEITAQPRLYDLDWAEATIPTPHGEVFIRAEKDGDRVVVTRRLPDGVRLRAEEAGDAFGC